MNALDHQFITVQQLKTIKNNALRQKKLWNNNKLNKIDNNNNLTIYDYLKKLFKKKYINYLKIIYFKKIKFEYKKFLLLYNILYKFIVIIYK